jgi:inorganic pyrophosphatase
MSPPPDFWEALDRLVAACGVTIDRPRGSTHPRYPDLVYPLDYGFLIGTQAADGGGIDVWVGSQAPRAVTGVICTVDALKRDAELKVLLGCTLSEAQRLQAFHADGTQAALLVVR